MFRDQEDEFDEDGTNKVQLVTAWTALPGLVPLRQGAGGSIQGRPGSSRYTPSHMGMCMAWEQKERLIVVGGDSKVNKDYCPVGKCLTEVYLGDANLGRP